MNLILLAACFLFFCHHHAPHKQHRVVKPRQDPCEQITKDYDSSVRRDDWVSRFPVKEQHRALVCLDKQGK